MRLLLTQAPLITPGGIVDGSLFIDTRRGIFLPGNTRPDRTVNLSGYALYPALINAHDHLELNHFPRTRFREMYPNAHRWGEEVGQHLDQAPFRQLRQYPLRDRCFIGGLKNILSGVTAVCHHNPLHRPLRRNNYPVHVLRDYAWAHSLHFTPHKDIQQRYQAAANNQPFIIHLAEGTDSVAADETSRLENLGVLGSNTRLVHGVGMTEHDIQQALERGAGLIWCPSTNYFLLGKTANVAKWYTAEKLALGSDSRLTAEGNLLDEIRAAHATGQLDARQIFNTVTRFPAQLLNLPNRGDLKNGMVADLIALPLSDEPVQTLLQAHRADLSLVMRNGQPIVADSILAERFSFKKSVPIELDGKPKFISGRLAHQIKRCSLSEDGLSFA